MTYLTLAFFICSFGWDRGHRVYCIMNTLNVLCFMCNVAEVLISIRSRTLNKPQHSIQKNISLFNSHAKLQCELLLEADIFAYSCSNNVSTKENKALAYIKVIHFQSILY